MYCIHHFLVMAMGMSRVMVIGMASGIGRVMLMVMIMV
jgi:hypothetical protein